MTKIDSLSKQYSLALKRLREVLDIKETTIVRDAAIQRFEFTFDLSWKLLKSVLQEDKGVVCTSPKDCFREAHQNHLIDYDDIWLVMTDQRNLTSHTYNEEVAQEIFKNLPSYLKQFEHLQKIIILARD